MRALLVDDEPLARRELRRLLAVAPWLEIVGEAANVDEARARVAELDPDLLFLDVQMPGGTGFDLLAALDRVPQVIFTTAYDRHAVRAFEFAAIDYLLKPVDPRRLEAALARVERRTATAPSATEAPPLERLFIRDGKGCWLVRLDEISLFAAEGNYVRVHWDGRSAMLARSLTSLEARLDPRRFFRANRQQIVPLDGIASIEPELGGRLLVKLRDGTAVEVSRRQARALEARLGA